MTLWIAATLIALSGPPQSPSSLSAQTPGRDLRATGSGTAKVRGVVVDEVTGTPVPGARVSIQQFDESGELSRIDRFRRETVADSAGRFEFTALPGGDMIVMAMDGDLRAIYLPRAVGHDRPYAMSRPSFHLRGGELKDGVIASLPRAHAIEGRVVNERGEPMVDLSVTAASDNPPRGTASGATDDRGEFRIFGLEPGLYRVCAVPREGTFGAPTDGRLRYDRTCAPGLARAATGDGPSVLVQMARTGTFTMRGHVVSTGGSDVSNVSVSFRRLRPEADIRVRAHVVGAEFVVRSLLPGQYAITASMSKAGVAGRTTTVERGFTTIRVDADMDDVSVAIKPPASVVGRVLRHPGATGPLPTKLEVRFVPPAADLPLAFQTLAALVEPDGAFRCDQIFGAVTVIVPKLPLGWFVESVRHGNEDITEQPHEFGTTDAAPVEILLSDRSAQAEIRAIDSDGRPVNDAMVLLVAADRNRWTAEALRHEVASKDGLVRFQSLRPGRYLAVALTPGSTLVLDRDGREIPALAGLGQTLALTEGPSAPIDLRVRTLGDIR